MHGKPFVLIHGAWHGGWCWRSTQEDLGRHGNPSFAPTLPGLAERAPLMSRELSLMRMVEDTVAYLTRENVEGAVLVGHSFGGSVITGIADQIPERIAALVYLDAAIIEAGETPFDRVPDATRAERIRAAREHDDGVSMPPPPGAAFGLGPRERWAVDQLTPHPLASYETPLHLEGPVGNGLPAAYVSCTTPRYPGLSTSEEWARRRGWRMESLPTAHDAMLLMPMATAALLRRLGAELPAS
ncbi:MAG: alpha/beta fold hydrolase [Myxococcota bacterium]